MHHRRPQPGRDLLLRSHHQGGHRLQDRTRRPPLLRRPNHPRRPLRLHQTLLPFLLLLLLRLLHHGPGARPPRPRLRRPPEIRLLQRTHARLDRDGESDPGAGRATAGHGRDHAPGLLHEIRDPVQGSGAPRGAARADGRHGGELRGQQRALRPGRRSG